MIIHKKGKILSVSDKNTKKFDGHDPVDFEVVLEEDDLGCGYIHYLDHKNAQGYDSWYQTMDEAKKDLDQLVENGWVIEWE